MEWWEFILIMPIVMPIVVLCLGCIIDIISGPDRRDLAKGLWTLFMLLFPVVGSLVYIIARPAGTATRA
jgi:Phospholipase_D-nuclease N-terminal